MVSRPTIAAHHTLNRFAQQFAQGGLAATDANLETSRRWRSRQPQPPFLIRLTPAGFVGVLDRGNANRLLRFVIRLTQRGGRLLFQVGDRSQGQRNLEYRFDELFDDPLGPATKDAPIRHQRRKIRPEGVGANVRRNLGPSAMTAVRTMTAVRQWSNT